MIATCKIRGHERLKERLDRNFPQVSLEYRKTRHGMEIHAVPGKYIARSAELGIKRMVREHESGLEVLRS